MSCCICMVQWQSVWMCIRYMVVDGNIFHLDQFVWMHDRIDCYIHECCISYCIYIGDWHVHLASISDFMLIPRLDKHDTYMEGLTKYLNLNLSACSTIGWSYDEWSNKEICPVSAPCLQHVCPVTRWLPGTLPKVCRRSAMICEPSAPTVCNVSADVCTASA